MDISGCYSNISGSYTLKSKLRQVTLFLYSYVVYIIHVIIEGSFEWIFYGSFQSSKKHTMEESLALNLGDLDLTSDDAWLDEVDGKIVWRRMSLWFLFVAIYISQGSDLNMLYHVYVNRNRPSDHTVKSDLRWWKITFILFSEYVPDGGIYSKMYFEMTPIGMHIGSHWNTSLNGEKFLFCWSFYWRFRP